MIGFGRRSATPTVRRMWAATVVRLLALIVGVGLVSLVAAHYQQTAFDATTEQAEAEMRAMVRLDLALTATEDPLTGVIYGLGGPSQTEQNAIAYAAARAEVYAAFDDVAKLEGFEDVAPLVEWARANWEQADASVLAAPELVASGVVAEELARGNDVFREPVWDALNETQATLTELRSHSVDDLHARTADVNRVQRLIAPLIIVAIVVAVVLAWLAGRKISRSVVTPILELRDAADRLRDADHATAVEVPRATAELKALARTINETALSLSATNSRLRDQASTDALTGLPNRKAFGDGLRALLDTPDPNRRVAVLFVDLDDFKYVNDTKGHQAGDDLLRSIADRLRSATRDTELVARLGGDEFAIALDCTDDATAPAAVAERLLAAMEEPVDVGAAFVNVGCSVGIAITSAGDGPECADELMRNADFAMYTAKSQGKNRYDVYSPVMHAELVARTELKRDITTAVRNDELELFFQPIVDVDTQRLLGFEALLRWHHPTRGMVLPEQFIPLAEESGAIVEIGAWVLDTACRELRTHAADGSGIWMSVNVSAIQLEQPGFTEVVASTLLRHRIDPDLLIIEITEAVAITNSGIASATLSTLRELGVHVALDDFGMGFSSLAYLRELPVDVLKIDRSFVSGDDRAAESTLEAIVTLGRSLGLLLIAEGIESESDLERLQRLGHFAGQGYYFARPMPADEASNVRKQSLHIDAR